MFILVRPAQAVSKRRWRGSDAERPLTDRGRQQAEGLAHNLSALYAPRLLSSPAERCRQTLAPLAERHARVVETSELLAVGASAEELDRSLLRPEFEGAVLCTHGETIAALLALWRRTHGVTFVHPLATSPGPRPGTDGTEKGAAWVIADGEAGRTAHYLLPLHVGPVLAENVRDGDDVRRTG